MAEPTITRELAATDAIVMDFARELRAHQPYMITGKYLPQLLGLARDIAEIEIVIPRIYRKDFAALIDVMQQGRFWPFTMTDVDELFARMVHQVPIRFGVKYETIPCLTVRFPHNKYEGKIIDMAQSVLVNDEEIRTVPFAYYLAFQKFAEKTEVDEEGAAFLKASYAELTNPALVEGHISGYEKAQSMLKKGDG